MKKNEGKVQKYEGKIQKYEGKIQKYEEKMKNYEGKTEKLIPLYIGRRTQKNSGPAGGGESYADTIPEMAPSTEKEGGSPAKKTHEKVDRKFQKLIDSILREISPNSPTFPDFPDEWPPCFDLYHPEKKSSCQEKDSNNDFIYFTGNAKKKNNKKRFEGLENATNFYCSKQEFKIVAEDMLFLMTLK